MEIRDYLNGKGFQWTEKERPSGLNAIMNCPFCGDKDKSFAINLSTGAYQCFRQNKCGAHGSWKDFQRKMGDETFTVTDKMFIGGNKKTKEYKRPTAKADTKVSGKVLDYLLGRGFNRETIEYFKISQKDNKTVMLPYYKDGKLVNVKYRDIDEKGKMWTEKEAEPVLFNRDNIEAEDLLIVEGEFDAMAYYQYGYRNVVSVPNGVSGLQWIDNEWEWLDTFRMIYLSFDNDVAGEEAVYTVAKKLGIWRCYRVVLPEKDCNDCLKKNIPLSVIEQCFRDADEFTPSTLRKAADFEAEVNDLIQNPARLNGTPTAFNKLTEVIKGWRKSEVTIWSGQNGAGKSTMLNQEMISLVERRQKVCAASLEMPPARYLRWAVIQATGQEYPPPYKVKEAFQKFGDSFYIVNVFEDMEIDKLLEVFKYAARRYDVQHFVIDSMMRLKTTGGEELREQKEIVTAISSFAKTFNVHVHLVAHPRKGQTDNDIPDKVDICGSGDIANLADNILVLWKPTKDFIKKTRKKNSDEEEDFDAVLLVKKNRETGELRNVKLWFDPATKRYRDH